MNLYRVTIDTLSEQYEYNVEAANEAHAETEAVYLAIQDGLDATRLRWVKVESID